MPIKDISAILGHSSVRQTELYVKETEAYLMERVGKNDYLNNIDF